MSTTEAHSVTTHPLISEGVSMGDVTSISKCEVKLTPNQAVESLTQEKPLVIGKPSQVLVPSKYIDEVC